MGLFRPVMGGGNFHGGEYEHHGLLGCDAIVSSSDSLNISKGPITSIFTEDSYKTLVNNYLIT